MPTTGFSTKPLKVKLLAGEQKATEISIPGFDVGSIWRNSEPWDPPDARRYFSAAARNGRQQAGVGEESKAHGEMRFVVSLLLWLDQNHSFLELKHSCKKPWELNQ